MPASLDDLEAAALAAVQSGPSDRSAVRAELGAIWKRLLRDHGDFGLDEQAFRDRVQALVERRHDPDGDPDSTRLALLGRLALDDLYIAQGCARGSDAAWRVFQRLHGPQLDLLAARAATGRVPPDDARQELLAALLGGRHGEGSLLESYQGLSTLGSWLRVAMRHLVVDLFRSHSFRPLPGPDAPAAMAGVGEPDPAPPAGEPFIGVAATLARLVESTIRDLPDEERTMLLRYHRDGAILKCIGAEFGIHQATVLRHLERTRARVARTVLRAARERYGLGPDEVRPMMEVMADLFRFPLGPPEDDPAA